MSLFRITRDDFDFFTIVANPERVFSSGTLGVGTTGSVSLFPRGSMIEKEVAPLSTFSGTRLDDSTNIDVDLRALQHAARTKGDISSEAQKYISTIEALSTSSRKSHTRNINRFVPSFTYTDNTITKHQIRNVLMPYYRAVYPSAHWAHTNYHTLNFFTASTVPSDSAIIYPNASGSSSDPYDVSKQFTFDFWINCRYTSDDDVSGYKAGTIMHLSSSYAVSVVSGSNVDSRGKPVGFRLLLQLSHSAGYAPSSVLTGTSPHDLSFMSSDNSLEFNRWHHVTIRWGRVINNGTGSFVIDGEEKGRFVVTASAINHVGSGDPSVLMLGNFYVGSNTGNGAMAVFFANDPAKRDGLTTLTSVSGIDEPTSLNLTHPLNAELHDIKIYDRFINDSEIRDVGPPLSERGLKFYVPPFFTKESPTRKSVGNFGGVLQTPFFAIDSSTDDSFNVDMSFGVGGHYLNNENFGRDFVTGNYPRWFNLTGSEISTTSEVLSANTFLYRTGSVIKRNLSILPCDNGKFTPNFSWLMSGTNTAQPQIPGTGSLLSKYVNDLGVLDLSLISLNNLIATSSLRRAIFDETGSMAQQIMGASPERIGVAPADVLTIYQRTRDNSSNEVVYFDMSNLFYGERINPGSIELTDSNLSGSSNKVSIKLKDDGRGNLYRADSLTKHAKWNSVGNIFYNEGIMVIKSPNIPLFGEDQWKMKIEGEQSIHTMKITTTAPAGLVNSSSNPSYTEVSASVNANDKNSKFVYITDILYLDDNLNVVMKTNLSQPVVKRTDEKITFKSKMDW